VIVGRRERHAGVLERAAVTSSMAPSRSSANVVTRDPHDEQRHREA
jgi:hypothetical protein